MVDPAKTPQKSAAQLRKENILAKKANVEAKEAKKGGVRSSLLTCIIYVISEHQMSDIFAVFCRLHPASFPGQ